MSEKTSTRKMTPAARKARNAKITARTVFGAGLVISLAANVAASAANVAGIASGLWAPLALLAALALLENGSMRGTWAKLAVGFLALVAGWTSYWHLVEVLEMAGTHDPITLYLLPLTVDVLMALASPGMRTHRAAPARRRPAAKKATTPVRRLKVA